MGLFDSFDSLFNTAITDVSGILSGPSAGAGSIVGGLDTGVSPVPVSYPTYSGTPEIFGPTAPAPMPVMSSTPMVPARASVNLANAYPNLYGWILSKGLAIRKGISMLGSLLRRWGPNVLAQMVGWAVVQELLLYFTTGHGKRRRMNVANTKALRRSLRRLKGFERLSHRVSAQLSRAASRGRVRRGSRCTVCRKSPCAC